MERIFTSESVSLGHPDKLADQISDAVLDEFLSQDRESKVACETFITDGLVIVGGEASSSAYVDIKNTAKRVLESAGYKPEFCFDPDNFGLLSTVHEQSPDIRQGVVRETKEMQGAGDQGIMFGYAVREGENYVPLTLDLANSTMRQYYSLQVQNDRLIGPDAKCQYSVRYKDGKPVEIVNVLISMQHAEQTSEKQVRDFAEELISDVKYFNPEFERFFTPETKLVVNPTGKFVIGGPKGDTGLTGRKIIVDTYGGRGACGGGAFSGKDPSKVDRSASYMARYLAKNIVATEACDECLIQLSYMIGVAEPSSVYVKTDRGDALDGKLAEILSTEKMRAMLTPYGITETLNLKNPIYEPTARFGHFGRVPFEMDGLSYFPWERLDLVEKIRRGL